MVAPRLLLLSLCAVAEATHQLAAVPVARVAVEPGSRLAASSSLMRLRGGVREVEDMEDWEALLVEAADRLVVVDFTATWCGPCQRIAPAYAALAEEYGETAGESAPHATTPPLHACTRARLTARVALTPACVTAVFVKVDVDQLGELAQELGVTSMPTFLFFRSGEMIDSMRGADEDGLRALVEEHAAPVPAAA